MRVSRAPLSGSGGRRDRLAEETRAQKTLREEKGSEDGMIAQQKDLPTHPVFCENQSLVLSNPVWTGPQREEGGQNPGPDMLLGPLTTGLSAQIYSFESAFLTDIRLSPGLGTCRLLRPRCRKDEFRALGSRGTLVTTRHPVAIPPGTQVRAESSLLGSGRAGGHLRTGRVPPTGHSQGCHAGAVSPITLRLSVPLHAGVRARVRRQWAPVSSATTGRRAGTRCFTPLGLRSSVTGPSLWFVVRNTNKLIHEENLAAWHPVRAQDVAAAPTITPPEEAAQTRAGLVGPPPGRRPAALRAPLPRSRGALLRGGRCPSPAPRWHPRARPSPGLQTVPLGAKREPAPSGSRGATSLDRPFMGD